MNRIAWMDVAKGVSILLVVFYHALMQAELQGLQIASLYAEINAPLRYIRMPLFFAVSALLIGSASGLTRSAFVIKWIVPTLWVLAVWNLIYAFLDDARLTPHELVEPYGHLWFLCALILFRLAWSFLDKVRLPAVLAAGILSLWMLWDRDHSMDLLTKNTLTYLFFFLAAAWYGKPVAAWITANRWLALGATAIVVAVCWKLAFLFGVALAGVGMFCAASALIASVRLPCNALRWLGRHSLEIFLLHYALLLPLIAMTRNLPAAAWLMPPLVTAGAIAIPIALRKASDQIAPWLFRLPRLQQTATA